MLGAIATAEPSPTYSGWAEETPSLSHGEMTFKLLIQREFLCQTSCSDIFNNRQIKNRKKIRKIKTCSRKDCEKKSLTLTGKST